jgi:hypothetical protein
LVAHDPGDLAAEIGLADPVSAGCMDGVEAVDGGFGLRKRWDGCEQAQAGEEKD